MSILKLSHTALGMVERAERQCCPTTPPPRPHNRSSEAMQNEGTCGYKPECLTSDTAAITADAPTPCHPPEVPYHRAPNHQHRNWMKPPLATSWQLLRPSLPRPPFVLPLSRTHPSSTKLSPPPSAGALQAALQLFTRCTSEGAGDLLMPSLHEGLLH
eukprot:jgi/Ulvmu1/4285/UM002_0004.1